MSNRLKYFNNWSNKWKISMPKQIKYGDNIASIKVEKIH